MVHVDPFENLDFRKGPHVTIYFYKSAFADEIQIPSGIKQNLRRRTRCSMRGARTALRSAAQRCAAHARRMRGAALHALRRIRYNLIILKYNQIILRYNPVSYTHLTLPTILLV